MNKAQLKKIDKHVGQQLRAARIARGYTQEALAAGLKITFQQLQKYESGKDRMSASRMYQVAIFLKMPPTFFFAGLPTIKTKPLPLLEKNHIKLLRYYDDLSEKDRKDVIKFMKIVTKNAAIK